MKKLLMSLAVVMTLVVMVAGCEREDVGTGGGQGDEPTATDTAEEGNESSPEVDVITLDSSNFDEETESGVMLVDFWAEWCPPCKIQEPIVEEVAKQVEDEARVGKLDIEDAPEIAQRYDIQSIPTLIIFGDGEPVEKFMGVTRAEKLLRAIREATGSELR